MSNLDKDINVMSLAGIRSNRGDAYQRAIALYWVVQMLLDDGIEGMQVDSIALPDGMEVLGDDIVIIFSDGKKHYIQAKVNQSAHQYWRLNDTVLRKELLTAKKQLLADDSCEFHFYSQTPFGVFQRFVSEVRLYPNYKSFQSSSAPKHQEVLNGLAILWSLSKNITFDLTKRIFIGTHLSVEQWDDYSLNLLEPIFSRASTAIDILWTYIDRQHSKLGSPQYIIDRKAILGTLEKHGIYQSLTFDERALLNAFAQFSAQGRQWVRSIAGEMIPRPALEKLKNLLNTDASSILLEDVAGGGKTCILLDLMDHLDVHPEITSLFIKGDLFSSITSLADLTEYGLPSDLVAQCAHLAEKRRLVVVIDSLDVLAVGRSHHALQSFLGFVAQLSKVPNATVIAASRTFDAKYDPFLRETPWSVRLEVEPLSFDSDVSPLLMHWGVPPDEASLQLREMLSIPQNLRLFYALISSGLSISDLQGHDLYDAYIRGVIARDPLLGTETVNALQDLAANLLESRSYEFPRNRIQLEQGQYQRLLSHEVLTEISAHQIMFSHQTLADALRIRRAQQNGVDLLSFVTSQPQFPFIRPSIRAFILSLRAGSRDAFTRQLRLLLNDDRVAIHIKRLAVETLADMPPTDTDLVILRQLSARSPALFARFLSRAQTEEWFLFLHKQWLPGIDPSSSASCLSRYLNYAARFKNKYSDLLINLWRRACDERWIPEHSLAWNISHNLADINRIEEEGIEPLLKILVNANSQGHSDIGKAISRYVSETGKGDELLWQFITKDAITLDDNRFTSQLVLHCDSHHFHSDCFLEQRLKESNDFLGMAIDYLENLSPENSTLDKPERFDSVFLHDTSWLKRHSKRDMYPHDSINTLLDAVEAALKYRSGVNDEYWHICEQRLRHSQEIGFRYLLCEAYWVNITSNLEGISAHLCDIHLLRFGRLEYELGRLSSEAYPYLSEDCQVQHQHLIMKLYEEIGDKEDWVKKLKFDYICWIPVLYRSPNIDGFYRLYERRFGPYRPEPSISSWGGIVSSPVSVKKLIGLPIRYLVKLLQHYNFYHDWGDCITGGLSGNRESLCRALETAVSLVPENFIPVIKIIDELELADEYIFSIIQGIATHLDARFGNTQHSGWKAIEPLTNGNTLALTMLSLIELYGSQDKRGYSTVRAIEACCYVLNDNCSLNRIFFQLWRLSIYNDPDPAQDDEAESLVGRGINSVRGRAADCVLILTNRLLDINKELPCDIRQLLERYSKDPSIVVRATMLRRMPYLLSRKTELGWSLISFITSDKHQRLWKHLGECLYYNYHSHFERVKPFLDRLQTMDDDKSSQLWGRLATLSYLSGKIDREALFQPLRDPSADGQRSGAGKVFVANLSNPKYSSYCVEGLESLIKIGVSAPTYGYLERNLDDATVRSATPLSLVWIFIDTCPVGELRDINNLFAWMVNKVIFDADAVLLLLERLMERLSGVDEHVYFYRSEDLVVTLKLLLQEADILDSPGFIDRILAVQDWFIDQGVEGVEELLENG